ncbi:hypothetical protein AMAG_20663 [Allomyces macrogynus ATCC 38327]|uniref:PH domain-containing protein n=1 Tax=Allomyces macrogynus (strain ATCC 38327) TaxID=578462 RepID=A0A0L0TEB3_ALLM3|nr:hypothetical protein AMAG_20663 [Allomyces macrogynus ATCC 38327]|eukprot:KNE73001.1 hypothetical protein AMAG_20663 [Allomyces macrogynus ATCC 38327]
MLYAVGFTFMALVGRLVAAVAGDSPNQPRKSVTSNAVAPGTDLNGTYPFMTTWRATHVYINFTRSVVAVHSPSPTATTGGTGGGRAGSARVAAAAAANAAAQSAASRKMGDVFPLAALGFETSPAGAPHWCIELVHFPTGAAWVVQLNAEEVAVWAQALNAITVVVTAVGGGKSSGRSSSNEGGGGSGEGQLQQPARSRSPSVVRRLQPGEGGVDC